MFQSSSSSTATSTTSLGLLAAISSISLVAATEITTDQLYSKIAATPALPGFNVEGGSVFENYVEALKNGQLFFIDTATLVYERPGSDPVQNGVYFDWCSDLLYWKCRRHVGTT